MPKLLNTLRNIVLYVVLAKHDNEQSDLLHRVAEERLLEDLPNYQKVLEKFTTKELISQADFSAEYEALLRDGAEATGVFSRDEAGEKRWVDLKARVVEHNIRSVRFSQHISTYPTAQDDGPVLHKDPSWPHGDFAGAHRGRN